MLQNESHRTKVLIVDDSEAVIATLQILLSRADYEVVAARDCAQGMSMVQSENPDVILLDWILPDGDGPQLLRRIREFMDVPCIMVTAQDSAQHCVEALEAGCDDFISKPIRPNELLLRLERLLATRELGPHA